MWCKIYFLEASMINIKTQRWHTQPRVPPNEGKAQKKSWIHNERPSYLLQTDTKFIQNILNTNV